MSGNGLDRIEIRDSGAGRSAAAGTVESRAVAGG